MSRYAWAAWGDVNAFFGLILDNVAVMICLVVFISGGNSAVRFTPEFVLTQMVPGTALGVLIGDLVYTWMAFRLARRTGRTDVTAMPLGLDTPSTFAVGPLVLLPALGIAMKDHHMPHDQAMVFAWHVGAVVLVISGLFKSVLAPLGGWIRSAIPRAALLGSLAGVALALIAFLPLWQDIATMPVVGLVTLFIILVTMVAHRRLPFHVPGAVGAVCLGLAVYWAAQGLGAWTGQAVVPAAEAYHAAAWRAPNLLPAFTWNAHWWQLVLIQAAASLPVMLPFALATIVGGLDCTESAAAAGDEYDTRTVLLTEGIASLVAGLAGGVIQNTPYIGQPAYKAMGGRAAYTLATAVFIGVAGAAGWFIYLFAWLPQAVMFPILVFVGLEITAQSYRATPPRHLPAVALAAMPALAYLATIVCGMVLGDQPPPAHVAGKILALTCLSNGFIVTSLLWAAALAAILDDHLIRGAICLVVAAGCTLVGVIHSPLPSAPLALPHQVIAQMSPEAIAACLTPYHWAAGYLLAAAVLLGLHTMGQRRKGSS